MLYQADNPKRFPPFTEFVPHLFGDPDEVPTREAPQRSENVAPAPSRRDQPAKRGVPSKEEIMESGKKVADLDMRRIKKHIAAGRWEYVPEHMRPPDKR
jgi:hypothetical protein